MTPELSIRIERGQQQQRIASFVDQRRQAGVRPRVIDRIRLGIAGTADAEIRSERVVRNQARFAGDREQRHTGECDDMQQLNANAHSAR